MLTGFNLQAACILLPLCTSIYTSAGGLRATFIASYTHSLVLFCVIVLLCIYVSRAGGCLGWGVEWSGGWGWGLGDGGG